MSSAFSALIWWLIPLAALIGALGYVLWVTKFQEKFQNETTRSVGQFQRFQSSFRDKADADASAKENATRENATRENSAKENAEPEA